MPGYSTLSTIRADVRNRLDETTARFWSNSELNNWINEATKVIARRTEDLQSFFTAIHVIAGTYKYFMPTDVIRVHRVEFIPTGSSQNYPISLSTYEEMDQVWGIYQQQQMSYPYYAVLWGASPNMVIQLYPSPAQGGDLNIFYYRLPILAVNDTDVVEVPIGWEDLVSLYCEFVARRKDKDPTWADAKKLFDEQLEIMIEQTRQWHDQARTIYSGNTAIPQWLYGGADF